MLKVEEAAAVLLGDADVAHATRCPSWSEERLAGRRTVLAPTINTSYYETSNGNALGWTSRPGVPGAAKNAH
jgi:hypothetical protein